MKNEDQIKSAQYIIKCLQDYIELARVQKKVKLGTSIGNVEDAINTLLKEINANVSNL